MPTSDSQPDFVVDTSVAVPLVVSDHSNHEEVLEATADFSLGLAGHAAFETFSVLTRLPSPARLTPSAAGRVLSTNFPHPCFLRPAMNEELLSSLSKLDISGGSVYDALVGCAAKDHELTLLTRDHRAIPTYSRLRVDYQLLGGRSASG